MPATETEHQDTTAAATHSAWKAALDSSKAWLPWLMVAAQLIYGYGVKVSTSDRVQQQQIEDHLALQDMRKSLEDLSQKQSGLSAKIDLIVAQIFRGPHDAQK